MPVRPRRCALAAGTAFAILGAAGAANAGVCDNAEGAWNAVDEARTALDDARTRQALALVEELVSPRCAPVGSGAPLIESARVEARLISFELRVRSVREDLTAPRPPAHFADATSIDAWVGSTAVPWMDHGRRDVEALDAEATRAFGGDGTVASVRAEAMALVANLLLEYTSTLRRTAASVDARSQATFRAAVGRVTQPLEDAANRYFQRIRDLASAERLAPRSVRRAEAWLAIHGSRSAREGNPSPASLDSAAIHAVALDRVSDLQDCHEDTLIEAPTAAGRVTVRFTIGADGHVSESHVVQADPALHDAAACIADAVRGWEFPRPAGGASVVVNYPFDLRVDSASDASN